MNHNYVGKCLPYDETMVYKPVHIKRNVWIGMNVTIAPGVTIGEGAIIGIGSVVARDVPPMSIVGSAPLRELKTRDIEHYQILETKRSYGGMSGYAQYQNKHRQHRQ
jgi:acetyltransferase-like isoleucine patch superfamily enzyme